MYQDSVILCSASKYTEKYYLNPDFEGLPDLVKDELKVLCVLYVEEVGGMIMLVFDESGNLKIMTEANEDDLLFDEIGSALKVKDIQIKNRELFEQLEEYYAAFLGQEE
ncbi:MAG: hypothetical protein IIY49_03860 [Eubacterium sp.]|nr:hypothetical protein [Eubacterium sp.]